MTEPVFRCPDHGFTTAPEKPNAKCPECGADARKVVSGDRRRRLSKFVSGVLRHFPDDAGLELDRGGWTDYDGLARVVTNKYDWADRELLGAVAETDPKGRFEFGDDADRIRAAYGHSVDVNLGVTSTADELPDRLYHGTDPANLASIRTEGLKPMGRQQVHLSGTPEEAREVGRRHAQNPVVLEIDAAAMLADGVAIVKRGESTYTCEAVPSEYLDV
ncbi:RNA 2'-phosphotransferase [Halorussus lipolyticus]|uniref:RNA 2'-phosphotransferase n=1 Tax=Halorussus lipolyticus TaxID=3034024 RepID=UPI0023E85151|nr:RNA 2'-phosphotransferase [Halorussus sp. DT80]